MRLGLETETLSVALTVSFCCCVTGLNHAVHQSSGCCRHVAVVVTLPLSLLLSLPLCQIVWQRKLLAVDDRSGVVYEILDSHSGVPGARYTAVPRHILMAGAGNNAKVMSEHALPMLEAMVALFGSHWQRLCFISQVNCALYCAGDESGVDDGG